MTPANDNRPASYDALLAKHDKHIKGLSFRYARHDKEDFEQDLLAELISRWSLYNEEFAFATWVRMVAMNVCVARSRYRNARMRKADVFEFNDDRDGSIADPTHEIFVDLAKVVARLSATRNGRMLIQHALGEEARDIGREHGISKARVHQILTAERQKLKDVA